MLVPIKINDRQIPAFDAGSGGDGAFLSCDKVRDWMVITSPAQVCRYTQRCSKNVIANRHHTGLHASSDRICTPFAHQSSLLGPLVSSSESVPAQKNTVLRWVMS